ncbi:hypothetical protein ACET92_20805 [Aeromonas veronii]
MNINLTRFLDLQSLLPMSVVATSMYLVLSPLAHSAPSENTTLPVHGRQIVVTQSPVITGTGVATTNMSLSAIPKVNDADNDRLVDWYYQWLVGGVGVANEALSSSATSIPNYRVQASDIGKTVQLRLRAVADGQTSYPESTRYSEPILSNVITAQAATLAFSNPATTVHTADENFSFGWNEMFTSNVGTTLADIDWSFSGDIAALVLPKSPTDNLVWVGYMDYENPKDANKDNIYDITVTIRDRVRNISASKNIRYTVRNVQEDVTSIRVVDASSNNITANPVVGQVLHSAVILNDGQGERLDRSDVTYQWKRTDSRVGGSPVVISGATSATYTVKPEDQGYRFRVEVTGK